VKDAVAEQSLLKIGSDLGTAVVDYTKRRETIDTLKVQVREYLENSNEVSQITQEHFRTQSPFENQMGALRQKIAALESQLKNAGRTRVAQRGKTASAHGEGFGHREPKARDKGDGLPVQ
jgi:hypothetical protein